MSYVRVIPRDLFNEANLLKCYGQLWLWLDSCPDATLDWVGGSAFDIQQDPASGALTIANLALRIHGKPWALSRPLNSRESWPLYATSEDEEMIVSVFAGDGTLSEEFEAILDPAEPAA